MDRLIVKGLGVADGEYDFDLVELANIGTPGSLTTRELHKVKLDAGVLPAAIVQAVSGLDAGLMVCLASILITRNGKRVNEERLWDARFVYGFAETPDIDAEKTVVAFVIANRAEEEEEQDPPAMARPSSPSGGESSRPTSDEPASDPSPTGPPASLRSVTSGQETLAS